MTIPLYGIGKNPGNEKGTHFVVKSMKKTRQIAMLRGTNGYWYLLSMLPIPIIFIFTNNAED